MVEYALHSLVYLIDVPPSESIGIKDLSEFSRVIRNLPLKSFR